NTIAVPDYYRILSHDQLFSGVSAYRRDTVTLLGAGDPDQEMIMPSSPNLSPVLEVQPPLGRGLAPSDSESNVVVISDRVWRRNFQADPGVVGRTVSLSDQQFTIIGVMGRNFGFPDPYIQMWIPLRITPGASIFIQQAVARMKDGVA